jgi:hypothetical protein
MAMISRSVFISAILRKEVTSSGVHRSLRLQSIFLPFADVSMAGWAGRQPSRNSVPGSRVTRKILHVYWAAEGKAAPHDGITRLYGLNDELERNPS